MYDHMGSCSHAPPVCTTKLKRITRRRQWWNVSRRRYENILKIKQRLMWHSWLDVFVMIQQWMSASCNWSAHSKPEKQPHRKAHTGTEQTERHTHTIALAHSTRPTWNVNTNLIHICLTYPMVGCPPPQQKTPTTSTCSFISCMIWWADVWKPPPPKNCSTRHCSGSPDSTGTIILALRFYCENMCSH